MEKTKKDLEDLKKQFEECQKQRDEYLNGWKRERADFLNYKKEEMERIEKLIKYANEELLLKFLPILDNFELAEKKLSGDFKENEWVKGVLNIKIQILDFLKNQGIEEIKCLGQKFDPNFQEIVEDVEAKEKESGIVIEKVKKGYTMYGRVIRPAKVKVAK